MVNFDVGAEQFRQADGLAAVSAKTFLVLPQSVFELVGFAGVF